MRHYLKQYRGYLILGAIVVIALLAVFLVSAGYYPVAMVNGKFISARIFFKDYGAALAYANFIKEHPMPSVNVEQMSVDEIARSTMDRLVENVLLGAEAKKEAGSDLETLVQEKVDDAAKEASIEDAVKTVYGLSLEDFKNNLLKPQAERDILTGRLFLKGKNVAEWLADAKKSANVIFFSGRFRWSGERVELK